MKLMKWIERMVRVIATAIAVVRFIVVLFAVLAGLAVIAAGVIAYLKRDQWTKPAYRWARDKSGRWSMTPWTPAEPGAAGPGPVVEPIPADKIAS